MMGPWPSMFARLKLHFVMIHNQSIALRAYRENLVVPVAEFLVLHAQTRNFRTTYVTMGVGAIEYVQDAAMLYFVSVLA